MFADLIDALLDILKDFVFWAVGTLVEIALDWFVLPVMSSVINLLPANWQDNVLWAINLTADLNYWIPIPESLSLISISWAIWLLWSPVKHAERVL